MADDPICRDCVNRRTCQGLCPPLTWINGRVALRESLITDDVSDLGPLSSRDYNDTLSILIEDRRQRDLDALDAIRSINSMCRRLIAAAVLVGVPQRAIANLCHQDQGTISRILRGVRR